MNAAIAFKMIYLNFWLFFCLLFVFGVFGAIFLIFFFSLLTYFYHRLIAGHSRLLHFTISFPLAVSDKATSFVLLSAHVSVVGAHQRSLPNFSMWLFCSNVGCRDWQTVGRTNERQLSMMTFSQMCRDRVRVRCDEPRATGEPLLSLLLRAHNHWQTIN